MPPHPSLHSPRNIATFTRFVRTHFEEKPSSNIPIALGGWVLTFAIFFWASRTQASQPHLSHLAAVASLSLPFFGTALAQLRSGYFVRNLAPGLRGLHRSAAPRRFVLSIILHFTIAFAFLAFALWRFTHPA